MPAPVLGYAARNRLISIARRPMLPTDYCSISG
jgi:hypothetical protein